MSTRRIDIIGGGPGGLYAARLLKVARPDWAVTVYERMAGSGDTFGFGVGLTVSTMTNLLEADPASAEDIRRVSHTGHGLLMLGATGDAIDLHGARNLSIARSSLLEVLARQAAAAGVDIRSGVKVAAADLDGDVVIAADGVRSATRQTLAKELGAHVEVGRGRYLWCGSDFALDDAIFSQARTEHGLFVAHAYPYADNRSTFLIEADETSWRKAGLDLFDGTTPDGSSDERSLDYLQTAFSADLGGHQLLSNRTRWSQFNTVHLQKWSHGNTVLIGDAAHTAHYTLGSGTKLALEDAIALSQALLQNSDVRTAFAAYEESRRPSAGRFQHLAARSQRWWESYYLRADQPLPQLAIGFMTRAGNISIDRFASDHPDVVADALGVYAGTAPGALPSDITTWALDQPYTGDTVQTAARTIDGHELDSTVAHRTVTHSDPWGIPGDRIANQLIDGAGNPRVVWLHGADDQAAVQGRIDLAERIKLQYKMTVILDIPAADSPQAAAGLIAGRCDLVHLTN